MFNILPTEDKCVAPSQDWLKKFEVRDLHALVQFVCHTHISTEKENRVLSHARQPEVDFFQSLDNALAKFLGQIASLKIKTPGRTNMVASTHVKR